MVTLEHQRLSVSNYFNRHFGVLKNVNIRFHGRNVQNNLIAEIHDRIVLEATIHKENTYGSEQLKKKAIHPF